MKKLKPSMRENKRYLLLEGKFDEKDVERAILDFLGILGYSKSAPIFIEKHILAVNREYVDKIRAALCLAKKQIIVKRVSGSLKKVK